MMPDTPLEERITKQWGDLGFQGKDPQTDFRGMGMLCFVVSTLESTHHWSFIHCIA